MANENRPIDRISRSLAEYLSEEFGISEETIREIINVCMLETIGDMNNLNTNAKDLIVNAINEISTDITDLESQINSVFLSGNDVKIMLVEALIANGINDEDMSTSDKLEELVAYIDWFNDYKGFNIYQIEVSSSNYTLNLRGDLRGDTTPGPYFTDWGDGTIDTLLSHTYTSAGTYIVKTKYCFTDSSGTSTDGKNICSNVLNINNKMTNANYMFINHKNLSVVDANDWDVSNITSMDNMFSDCTKLSTLHNDKWVTSNLTSAVRFAYNTGLLVD